MFLFVHDLLSYLLYHRETLSKREGRKSCFRPLFLPTTGARVVMPVARHGAEIFARAPKKCLFRLVPEPENRIDPDTSQGLVLYRMCALRQNMVTEFNCDLFKRFRDVCKHFLLVTKKKLKYFKVKGYLWSVRKDLRHINKEIVVCLI